MRLVRNCTREIWLGTLDLVTRQQSIGNLDWIFGRGCSEAQHRGVGIVGVLRDELQRVFRQQVVNLVCVGVRLKLDVITDSGSP